MAKRFQPPEICPVCGEDVPRNARACPECGACEESGWSEGAEAIDAVGGGSEEFDYDRFVEEEFGQPPRKPAIGWLWWLVALVLLLLMLLPLFLR